MSLENLEDRSSPDLWPEQSESLQPVLVFLYFFAYFLYSELCNYKSSITCKRFFQTSACKPKNQCEHQQLWINFLSWGPILLRRWSEKYVTEGSKYTHWLGLYLSFRLSWVLGSLVYSRLQNLKTSEATFGHSLTTLIKQNKTWAFHMDITHRFLLQFLVWMNLRRWEEYPQ